MNKLNEFAELWHRFENEEIGLFDLKECEQINKLRFEIESALKLQELVNDKIKKGTKSGHKLFSDEGGYLEQELQSMVEQSQTTKKEEGKAT